MRYFLKTGQLYSSDERAGDAASKADVDTAGVPVPGQGSGVGTGAGIGTLEGVHIGDMADVGDENAGQAATGLSTDTHLGEGTANRTRPSSVPDADVSHPNTIAGLPEGASVGNSVGSPGQTAIKTDQGTDVGASIGAGSDTGAGGGGDIGGDTDSGASDEEVVGGPGAQDTTKGLLDANAPAEDIDTINPLRMEPERSSRPIEEGS